MCYTSRKLINCSDHISERKKRSWYGSRYGRCLTGCTNRRYLCQRNFFCGWIRYGAYLNCKTSDTITNLYIDLKLLTSTGLVWWYNTGQWTWCRQQLQLIGIQEIPLLTILWMSFLSICFLVFISTYIFDIGHTGCFCSLVLPNFSTNKKTRQAANHGLS